MHRRFWLYYLQFLSHLITVSQNENTTSEGSVHYKTTVSVSPTLSAIFFTLPVITSRTNLYNPTLGFMEFYIQNDFRVQRYLSGFGNTFLREVVEMQMTFCPFTSLCNFDFDAHTSRQSCCEQCSCDNCEGTVNCCPSTWPDDLFNSNHINTTDETFVDTLLRKFNSANGVTEPVCISNYLTARLPDEGKGFLAIAGCPADTDSILRRNCSKPYNKFVSIESSLPVKCNSNLKVFRNKYCALCNGVNEEDLIFFSPVFSCKNTFDLLHYSTKDILGTVYSTEDCSLKFEADEIDTSECKYAISMCNVTGLWEVYDARTDFACQTYQSVFRYDQHLYRNLFCAICNGIQPENVTCTDREGQNSESFPFSGLLRLEFGQSDKTSGEWMCTHNQIFDSLMERCKNLSCSQLMKLQNKGCVSVFNSIKAHFSYTLFLRLRPLSKVTISEAFNNPTTWTLFSSQTLNDRFPDLTTCKVQMVFKSGMKFGRRAAERISDSSLLYIDIRLVFSNSDLQRPWDIVDYLLKIHGSKIDVAGDDTKSVEYVVYVKDQDDHLYNIIEQLFEQTNIHSKVKTKQNAKAQIAVLAEYALSDTDGMSVLPYSPMLSSVPCSGNSSEVHVLHLSACPKVNVSKQDISWSDNAGGIAIGGLNVNSTDFYYLNHDHIMICADVFKKILRHLIAKRHLTAEIVLSIVCISFSIFSLLISLLTFCILPSLRVHLPGKNNVSLISVLLIAQIMFLIGTLSPMEQYSVTCKIVGLFTHFVWLCSIFWMNVCTYHMFHVLTQTTVAVGGKELKRFLIYHVYVVAMGMVFVLANVISSSVTSSNDDLGYGGEFCYLTSQDKLLFTFVIPTVLVIVTNLIMFLFVVMKIRRSSDIHKSVKHERNDLVILTKLSTLTGLTWTFGVLYAWTSIKIFSYIFIILNGSQGVFIMLAFVVNRRVFALFKDLKVISRHMNNIKKIKRNNGTQSADL